MRILLPLHRLGAAGIGTVVEGLREHVPHQLSEADCLLTVAAEANGNGNADVRMVEDRRPRENPLGRFMYEQHVVRRAAAGVDLLHLTDYRPLLASTAPFLLTVHDLYFLDRPEWYPRSVVTYKRAMLRLALLKKPRVVVCDSSFTRKRLLDHWPAGAAEDIRVIHPGVAPPPPAAVRSDEGAYFLTVSTVEPRKNHLTLLDAFAEARRQGLNLRWKVVGAPGYKSTPIIHALRATEGVDVLGRVDRDELERLYDGATFHVTPSHGEGFGFPPLEAMIRGVPTIASTGSALDETVAAASCRVQPEDARGWTEALLAMERDDALRRRLSERGAGRVRRFGWDLAAKRYVEAYRAALGLPAAQ